MKKRLNIPIKIKQWITHEERPIPSLSYSDFPLPLKKAVLFRGLITLVIAGLSAWLATSTTTMESLVLIILVGVAVTFAMGLATFATYYMTACRCYQEIEGVCIKNGSDGNDLVKKSYSTLMSRMRIQMDGNDGKAYAILYKDSSVARRLSVRKGYVVRVYVPKNSPPVLRDGEYIINNYLAIEPTGEKATAYV